MSQEKRPPMATWLKVTIIIAVLGFVSFAGLLIVGGIFLANATKTVLDPKVAAKVSDSVAVMEDPLPDGFIRVMAFEMMGMSEVAYANKNTGLSIMLMKMQKTPVRQSADSIIDHYVKSGTPSALGSGSQGTDSSPMVIRESGKMTVGGEEMPYAIGERRMGVAANLQLLGCVVPAKTGQAVVILGQSTTGKAYPMEATKRFLAAIKSF